jgi:hypothetical protein
MPSAATLPDEQSFSNHQLPEHGSFSSRGENI